MRLYDSLVSTHIVHLCLSASDVKSKGVPRKLYELEEIRQQKNEFWSSVLQPLRPGSFKYPEIWEFGVRGGPRNIQTLLNF